MVVCQVTGGIPTYELKDEAGSIKTVHPNQLFLVATPVGDATPLGAGVPLSEENAARSTLVELISMEVESNSPEDL